MIKIALIGTALLISGSAFAAQDQWGNPVSAKQERLASCRADWKVRATRNDKWKEQKGQPAYAAFIKFCIASKPV